MAFGQYMGIIGTVAGAVIGGVIGYFAGGQVVQGAMIGASLGGAIGGVTGQMFFPERADLNLPPPPQPNERAQQISTYGATIPKVWGSKRLAGNIIAMSEIALQTIRTRHRANGVRYYEMTRLYTCTFAIAFCEGPATGISRLWVNGQIFYDARDPSGQYFPGGPSATATANLATSLARAEQYFTIYTGSEDQLPDPALEAVFGAGQVPAYRGTCYIVFRDFPVGEYQGIPTIEAEIVAAGSATSEPHTVSYSPYTFSAHTGIDLEGNIVKFDTVTRRVHVFRGISDTLLRSFPTAAPSTYTFQGIGVEPSLGYLLLAFDNAASGGLSRVIHYIYTVEGSFISSWFDDTIVGTGDSGVFYCWTTEGLVIHYSTTAYYYFSWSYGSKMALYRDYRGELLDAVWGPVPYGATPDAGGSRYLPVFSLRPDPDSDIRMVAGSVHYRWRWSQMTRSNVNAGPCGVLPQAALVSQSLSPANGPCVSDRGDLISFDYVFKVLSVHAGISGTIRQRTRVLESSAVLGEVVTGICAAAGIGASLLDVTALSSDLVLGYYVPRQMPARTALELLMTAFSFDAAEVDWKLKFIKRGGSPIASIPASDLAAKEGAQPHPDELVETRAPDLELPSHLLLTYESKARDYQLATQSAVRVDRPMHRMATQQFGLVMTDEHAKRTAEILLKQLWQRRAYGFTTTHKWLKLAPCDVATVAGKDMRIVGMTDRQGVVEFAAEAEPGGTYQSSAQAQDLTFGLVDLNASIFVPNLIALELPLIDAAVDPALCVVYAALYGRPALYKGGVVRLSLDAGVSWTDAAAFDAVSAKVGSLEGTLGSGTHGALDYTRAFTVDFADSEYVPASATDEELANGANLVAVGSGNAWEVLQFKTAALVSGYRYTLTGLLRGLYGTEWAMGGHVVGERMVLLTGRPGLQAISVPVDRIGQSLIFLAAEGERTGADQALTPAGRSLKPLAAADVRGVRSPALDLNIAWARSDRREFVAPDLDTFEEAPQSDPPASYEVDIIHPITGGVLRTLVSATPAASYTAAQQNTDGYPAPKAFTDCSGDLATSPVVTNRSYNSTARFQSGQLQMQSNYNWSAYGPAVEVNFIVPRSGKIMLGFKWYRSLYVEANPFGDGSCGVYLVKQAPAYNQAAWGYNRPEYGVGNNSCLHLAFTNAGGRGSVSGLGQVKLAQRLSGTNSTLATSAGTFDYKAGADPKGYAWEIDFTNHTARVLADGAEIIPATAWSASLDAQLTANCQFVFHLSYYWDYLWYYFDDIGVYVAGAGAYPVTVDIFQKGALGRGYPRRAYV